MSFHCRRPQRARGDTMKYFRQVGQMLEDAEKNARAAPPRQPDSDDDDDDDTSELGLLVTNTLNEMLGQEASLASNANTSFAVEKLARHMSAKQLLAFTHNMSGLYCHLFSNRYSSHVVQTLLAQIAGCIARGEAAEEFVDCVGHIVEEVGEHFLDIVRDQSGSHALRTLAVVLNGFEPVAKKQFTTAQLKKQRQRKKNNKKKNPAAFEAEKPKSTANDVFQLYANQRPRDFAPPASFTTALCRWAAKLCALGHGTLTDTVLKNRHAAPLVQVLMLAVHLDATAPAIGGGGGAIGAESGEEEEQAEAEGQAEDDVVVEDAAATLRRFCATVLPVEEAKDVAAAVDRFSFLAKHEFGSRVLEVLLRCAPDGHFALLHQHAARRTCVELAVHPLANFAVQKYLECVRDVTQARQVVAAFVPKRKEEEAPSSSSDRFACAFDSSVVLGVLQAERYSVVSSLVRLAARLDTRQDRVFTAVLDACLHMAGVSSSSGGGGDDGGGGGGAAADVSQAAQVALLTVLNVDAQRVIRSSGSSEGGGDSGAIRTSVPRAQLVGALLGMDASVARPLASAIATLDQAVLEQFAHNDEVSRGVLEALVCGANNNNAAAKTTGAHAERFRAERRQVLRRLLPVYSALAGTMRGRFLVLKCFGAADAATRFKIARALAAQLRKLEGSKFGREVAAELRLELFEKSHSDWSNAMKPRSSSTAPPAAAGGGGGDGAAAAVAGGGKVKKKHKKDKKAKKNKKEKKHSGGAGEQQQLQHAEPQKRRRAAAEDTDAAPSKNSKKTRDGEKKKKKKKKEGGSSTTTTGSSQATGALAGYDFLFDAIAATKH